METAIAGKTAAPVIGHARMLHTMIRVFDLKTSVDFFTRLLGM